MRIAVWKEKLARFSRLDPAEQAPLLHAVAWLAIARIMLAVLPFRHLSARLSGGGDPVRRGSDPEALRRIGRAVGIAANHVPWRADCFPQTIAARMLLRREGYASIIHLGVARIGADTLEAHAWLTCAETVVTGGAQLERYTEMHTL